MLKAVIFDLDDTLCNSHEVFPPAIEKTFQKYLVHFPGKTVAEMVALERKAADQVFEDPTVPTPVALTLLWIKLFELLGLKPDLKAIIEMRRMTWEEMYKTINLLPGADELLDYLVSKKIKVGVLTNGPFLEQAEKLIILGIDKKVDYLVGTDLTMVDKPDPKAFNYILNKLGVKASEAVMVGDYVQFDILGAKSVGMRGILLKHDFRKHTPEEEKEADLVINSLGEALQFFKDPSHDL